MRGIFQYKDFPSIDLEKFRSRAGLSDKMSLAEVYDIACIVILDIENNYDLSKVSFGNLTEQESFHFEMAFFFLLEGKVFQKRKVKQEFSKLSGRVELADIIKVVKQKERDSAHHQARIRGYKYPDNSRNKSRCHVI